MADNQGNEFINVPVPVHHVTKVYELITRLEAGDQAEPETPPSNGGAPASLTKSLVQRMYRESEDAHRRLMEYLAGRPGEWLGSQSIADGLNLQFGRKSLAGSLGAFGRRADHRYGGLKPWDSHWEPEKYQAELRMNPEVATWIKAATAA